MSRKSSVVNIERFLRAKLAAVGAREGALPAARTHAFVTISRQSGTGGHALARTMLDVFARQDDTALFADWQVFDQEVCEVVAEDPKLTGSLETLLAEEYPTRTERILRQLLKPTTDTDYLMKRVFETVRMLAGIGHVIIVGRAGSELTRDLGPGLAVRLVAPQATRIARLMERDQIDERRARDRMARMDASRARLLKRHFGVDIDDPLAYGVTFNTAHLSHEAIAEAVAAALPHRVAAWHS